MLASASFPVISETSLKTSCTLPAQHQTTELASRWRPKWVLSCWTDIWSVFVSISCFRINLSVFSISEKSWSHLRVLHFSTVYIHTVQQPDHRKITSRHLFHASHFSQKYFSLSVVLKYTVSTHCCSFTAASVWCPSSVLSEIMCTSFTVPLF